MRDVVRRYDQTFPGERWVSGVAFIQPNASAWIVAARRGQLWMQAQIEASEATTPALHTVYFPGWTAYVDGRDAPIEPSTWIEYEEKRALRLGVSQVVVPQGNHVVTLVFGDTAIRTGAKVASGTSAAILGTILLVALISRAGIGRNRAQLGRLSLAIAAGIIVGLAAHQALLSPDTPLWSYNTMVRDLVAEAEHSVLQTSVPPGAKADDYVHVRTFTIQGDTRPVVYMHPPASGSTRVWLPERATLQFAIGIDPVVWDKAGDGVDFEAYVLDGKDESLVFSAYIDPKSNPSQRRWIDESVDLSGFAHKYVDVVFRTLPHNSSDYDWAGWATPRIVLSD